jgi:hypothetical protein
MSTTHNAEKKLAASALVAALPALVFLGAGTAQAKTCAVPGGTRLCFSVTLDPWNPVRGVTVHITNNLNAPFPQCILTATPDPNQPPQGLPTYTSPQFQLPVNGTYNLAIPTAVPTGAKWNVNVDCGGDNSEDLQQTF